jgi:FkbM family methyltransferase
MRGGFSYQGQDLFVLDALGGMREGFFIDSGASDGLHGSNTKLLESAYGWTGICVEPNAALFAELERQRSCVCLNCCLYDREGNVDFFEAARVFGGIVDEYDPEHLRYARATVGEGAATEIARKPARTVRSVLEEHGAPPVIDYWSLDTEGSELAILRSFPFEDYRFRVLTVEHNYAPVREDIRALLESHGYRRAGSLGIDDCYVWADGASSGAWQSQAWLRPRR